ncbi:MAG: hypothetical protein QXH55_05630 [Candidatus Korarchaeota archaeon]|nr:hypothetical protein [Thermoproteota archaeon]
MFEKIRPTEKISDIVDTYKKKIESSVIPPDPARILEFIMRGPPTVEHILPIPPVLETIHSEITTKFIEALPRFPLTSDPPIFKWKEWIKD